MNTSASFPLAAAQATLLWSEIFSLEKKNAMRENNLPIYFLDRNGDCSLDAMEKAFNRLLERNDALRLRFFWSWKGIRQSVTEYTYEILPRITLSDESEFQQAVGNVYDDVIRFFSKKRYRAVLYSMPNGSGGIVMNFHHGSVDGYSVGLIMERFEQYYIAYKNGELPPEEKQYSYVSYLEYEREYLKSPKFKDDFRYWWNAYNRQPDYQFPVGKRSLHGHANITSVTFQGEQFDRIAKFRTEVGCSEQAYILILSAITTYCLTGRKVFAVTSLTHGRTRLNFRRTIGCMMNIVPLMFRLRPEDSAQEIFSRNYANFLEALSHGRFPMSYQMLISFKYCILRGFNFIHQWLIVSMMDYAKASENSKFVCKYIDTNFLAAQMYCSILEHGEHAMTLDVGYQKNKFSDSSMQKILRTFQRIQEMILRNPSVTLDELRKGIA